MKQYITTVIALFLSIVIFAQTPAIQVKTSGKGQPVFLLPGFTCPGAVWDETVSRLKGDHQFLQVSYAGFGGQAPIETPWYESIKKELMGYITSHKLSAVTIIGHSMGGTLALDLAADLPAGVVKSIVVVDGLPCMRAVMMPGVSGDQLQYKSPYNDQLIAMKEEPFLKNAQMYARQMTNVEGKQAVLTDYAVKADRKTYVYGYTDLLKMDIRPSLSRIKVPALILAASFPNKEMVEKTMNSQFESLPNKTIEIVPESRHFIFFDQSEWFYNRINNCLNK